MTRELREKLERIVSRTFQQSLCKPLFSGSGRRYYQLSFMDGLVNLYVPEEELLPEVEVFLELGGETGIVVPGCLMRVKDPEAVPHGFWCIVRGGSFRPLLNHPNPADVFRKYAYDRERLRCFAVVRFDTRETPRADTNRLIYPDHLKNFPGSHLGLSGATLYEVFSL